MGFAGQIPARPAAVGHEISWLASSSGGAPHGPVRVAGCWPEVPPLVQSFKARKRLNGPTCVPGLESFFLGFWSSRGCFGG